MSRFVRVLALVVLAVTLVSGVSYAQTGPDQTGFTSDFEDGTLKGYVLPDGATVRNWGPRGGDAVIANSTEQAHGGTHSLKTTGRRRPYQGPSLNVLGKMTKGSGTASRRGRDSSRTARFPAHR